jgi:hypothetical protein
MFVYAINVDTINYYFEAKVFVLVADYASKGIDDK